MAGGNKVDGLLFFFDWLPAFEELSGDDVKALLIAMVKFRRDRTEPPQFQGNARIAASFIFPAIERSMRNAGNGRQGGRRTQDKAPLEAPLEAETKQDKTKQDKSKLLGSIKADKPPRARFVKPSIEEVREYCQESGIDIDPARFFDYYESNGWRAGKNPMKDWRAAARNWARRDQKDKPTIREEFPDGTPWEVV